MNKFHFSALVLSVLFTVSVHFRLHAQYYNGMLSEQRHQVTAGMHASPHLSAVAGYQYTSRIHFSWMHTVAFHTHFRVPLFSQTGHDINWSAGAVGLSKLSEKFQIRTGLAYNLSKTADLNGKYITSGFTLDCLSGYYGEKWILGVHLAARYLPWIHIRHSTYATQAFNDLYPSGTGTYTAPRDGWFIQQNLVLQTGAGVTYLHKNWNLQLIGGFQFQPNKLGLRSLPDIGIMPFYGGLVFGYGFGKPETKS